MLKVCREDRRIKPEYAGGRVAVAPGKYLPGGALTNPRGRRRTQNSAHLGPRYRVAARMPLRMCARAIFILLLLRRRRRRIVPTRRIINRQLLPHARAPYIIL